MRNKDIYIFTLTYVCKETHFYANQNVYLFLTLNNRECFNSQHIRFIKSTNFTKKDDAG